jgi:hypothetical protein
MDEHGMNGMAKKAHGSAGLLDQIEHAAGKNEKARHGERGVDDNGPLWRNFCSQVYRREIKPAGRGNNQNEPR